MRSKKQKKQFPQKIQFIYFSSVPDFLWVSPAFFKTSQTLRPSLHLEPRP